MNSTVANHVPTSSHMQVLVPRPQRWLGAVEAVLFWIAFACMFLPLTRDRTAWQVAMELPLIWLMFFALGLMIHRDAFTRARYRTPLHAMSMEVLRLSLIVGIPLMIFFAMSDRYGGLSFYYLRMGVSFVVGATTLCLVVIQVMRLISYGGIAAVFRDLVRRPPWKRWNWALLPLVLLAALAVVAVDILTVAAFAELVSEVIQFDRQGWEVVVGIIACLWLFLGSWVFLTLGLGMWERHGWALWVQLHIGASFLALVLPVFWEFWRRGWGLPLMAYVPVLAALVVDLYSVIVLGKLTGQPLQRGRCGVCNTVRWIRVGRCSVCGQWYYLYTDRAAPPVCLACGHEGSTPLCRECRAQHGPAGG